MNSTELAMKAQEPARTDIQPLGTAGLIQLAINAGQNPTELYAILREERARDAKAQFVAAKAKFKAECPPVPKSSTNPQFSVTEAGVRKESKFAPLDVMQTIADPHLANNGFSYDWQEDATAPESARRLLFILSHVGGHSETYPARITAPSKGGCSEPQKDGIAYEYARRQSFRNGTGIRVVGEDNDGNDPPEDRISGDESVSLLDALYELTDGSEAACEAIRKRFTARYGIENVADLPASKLADAQAAIDKMRAKMKG